MRAGAGGGCGAYSGHSKFRATCGPAGRRRRHSYVRNELKTPVWVRLLGRPLCCSRVPLSCATGSPMPLRNTAVSPPLRFPIRIPCLSGIQTLIHSRRSKCTSATLDRGAWPCRGRRGQSSDPQNVLLWVGIWPCWRDLTPTCTPIVIEKSGNGRPAMTCSTWTWDPRSSGATRVAS